MEEISVFSCPTLSTRQVKALAQAGFHRLWDLVRESHKQEVLQAASLSMPDYDKLVSDVTLSLQPEPFLASCYPANKQRTVRSTGVPGLDAAVRGGFFDGDLVEFYGGIGTGKSQLAMFICSEYMKKGETVAYFDLKGNFTAQRALQYCDEELELLANLEVVQPTNIVEMMEVTSDLEKNIGEDNKFYKELKLVIVDSVPMVIYPAVEADPESWRFHHTQLYEAFSRISHLNGGITVIFINHETTLRPSSNMRSKGQNQKQLPNVRAAMGGTYWGHTCNFRFRLAKDSHKKGCIKVTLEKSTRGESNDHNKEFHFRIEEHGIVFC